MVLHTEGLATHRHYLKPDGWIFFNSRQPPAGKVQTIDASGIALALCAPVCANLVLLGFAVGSGALFCSPPALETVLRRSGEKALETSVEAFHAGLKLAKAKSHA
jgi:Pyruvate/2-oxoacid:ferredoxin oxidoreductase gamma subunit